MSEAKGNFEFSLVSCNKCNNNPKNVRKQAIKEVFEKVGEIPIDDCYKLKELDEFKKLKKEMMKK